MPQPDGTFPVIRIQGMADFNEAGQEARVVTELGNWDSATPPTPVLVASAGPGSVEFGNWAPAEEYFTLRGFVRCPPEQHEAVWRQVLAGLPADRTVPLVRLGNGWGPDLQVFVRRYDRPTRDSTRYQINFTVPLVAPDPWKYGLRPLAGSMGVFTGETWYRSYALAATRWGRTYALTNGRWSRGYRQAESGSQYPEAAVLASAGDARSDRVLATVIGPLSRGDWWLVNESTGDRLWADLTVSSGQDLVIDCHARTASLSGSDATHLIYGDYLTVVPGQNLFRLVGGSQSSAFATVSALEAYQ